MLCPECSQEIRDTAKVCGYCGTKLTKQVSEVSPKAPESAVSPRVVEESRPVPVTRKHRPWARVGLLLLVAIAAVVALVVIRRDDGDQPGDTAGTAATAPATTTVVATTTAVATTTLPPVSVAPIVGTFRAPWDGDSELWLFIEPLSSSGRISVTQYDPVSTCLSEDETEDRDVSTLQHNDAAFDGNVIVFDLVTTWTCIAPEGDWDMQTTASDWAGWNLRLSPNSDALIGLGDLRYFPDPLSRTDVLDR